MAGAGASAAVAGASVVPIGWGITALTGFGIAVAAPVGLVAGAAIAGGAATYGVTQAVRFKARQHGKREQMIQQLNEILRDVSYAETKAQTTDADKTRFIIFLEEPIRLGLISPNDASDLIQLVENGQISLFEGYRLVKDILQEFKSDSGEEKILKRGLAASDVGCASTQPTRRSHYPPHRFPRHQPHCSRYQSYPLFRSPRL